MPFIDERVTQILADGKSETPVLIVCDADCDGVAEALSAKSIEVDRAAAELGIIRAVVDAEKLEAVKATDGVASVEPDEDVQAQ